MNYFSSNSKWYLAELVNEITVTGDLRNVIHKNLTLVRADGADEAYQKALAFGQQAELSYFNPAGQRVQIVFRGLAGLYVITDELEDGAEILFEERIGMPREDLEKWIKSKGELSVFRSPKPSIGPDYSSGEIMGNPDPK